MTLRVLKVGGSLLTRANLVDDLRAWWTCQPPLLTVMIVGGGAMIDVMRQWHQCRRSPEEAETHWRCIELLQYSYWHVAALLAQAPGWPGHDAISSESQWLSFNQALGEVSGQRRRDVARLVLVNVPAVYGRRHGDVLPTSWATTSDAIAMWLAGTLAAEECVLLKSCRVPASADLRQLASAGVVDPVCGELDLARSRWRVEQLPETDTPDPPSTPAS